MKDKDTKAIFNLSMTASEVVIQIMEANPDISAILFKVYTPTKNLKEESNILFRTFFDRVIYHSPPEREEEIWLERREITLEYLSQMLERLGRKRALAIASNVKIFSADNMLHIPMMDFDCEVSPENLERIQEFLRRIKQKGVILLSGRSYHYYGIGLLSKEDWLVFLGKCLLFTDYAESRYIGHRLIDSCAYLRISKNEIRPNIPKVIAIV